MRASRRLTEARRRPPDREPWRRTAWFAERALGVPVTEWQARLIASGMP